MLRAVRKAAPYLYKYPFKVGAAAEDTQTRKLVQLFLDQHILSSCSGPSAFLSRYPRALRAAATGSPAPPQFWNPWPCGSLARASVDG